MFFYFLVSYQRLSPNFTENVKCYSVWQEIAPQLDHWIILLDRVISDEFDTTLPENEERPVLKSPKQATIFFSSVAALWLFAAGLSTHLEAHRHGKQATRGNTQAAAEEGESLTLSQQAAALKQKVDEDPKNTVSRLKFARQLLTEGAETRSGGLLMSALKEYQEVLELQPSNTEAMVSIAKLCLEQGIFDKAADYYRRYLNEQPEDLQARTDLGLALIQMELPEDAIAELDKVLAKRGEFFPALLAMALAKRMQGDIPGAKVVAQKALASAPNEEGKMVVDKFLARLDKPQQEHDHEHSGKPTGAAHASDHPLPDSTNTERAQIAPVTAPAEDQTLSPAMAVERFFRGHSIVGRKVTRISWPSGKSARVEVRDFPVQAMPEFARRKFEATIQGLLAGVVEVEEIELVDADTGVELLRVSKP